jgi:hypothetical protein
MISITFLFTSEGHKAIWEPRILFFWMSGFLTRPDTNSHRCSLVLPQFLGAFPQGQMPTHTCKVPLLAPTSVSCLSLRFLPHFLWDHPRLRRWWLVTSLVARVHPPNCWEKSPPDANGQFDQEEGHVLPASQGEGLGCTTEPGEAQEPARGGGHCLSDW